MRRTFRSRSWRSGRFALAVAIAAAVFVAPACRGQQKETQAPAPAPKRVVIATLLSHPSLDEIATALRTRMGELGWREGVDIAYVDRNANGNPQLTATIAADIQQMRPDAVVPITTPMAQAVAKAVSVPIVFAAVTDPVGAGLVASLAEAKENMTGVADAWPYEQQLELLREIQPKVRRVAVLLNPADPASDYGIRQIRAHAERLGFELVEASCASSSEVGTVAASVIDRVDAVYLSSDATVISGFAGAARVCFRAKKPLIVGDRGTVEKGGLATVSVGYSGVGRETANLLDRVLKGERRIPVVVARGDELFVNLKAAELSGITIPDGVKARAKEVFLKIP